MSSFLLLLMYFKVTKLRNNEYYQETLFDFERSEKQKKLDKTLDDFLIGGRYFYMFLGKQFKIFLENFVYRNIFLKIYMFKEKYKNR